MNIVINAEQLKKALRHIRAAEKNGFMFCQGVFEIRELDGVFGIAYYSDLFEKAHPTDGSLNWGRFQSVTKHNKFIDGKLVSLTPPYA